MWNASVWASDAFYLRPVPSIVTPVVIYARRHHHPELQKLLVENRGERSSAETARRNKLGLRWPGVPDSLSQTVIALIPAHMKPEYGTFNRQDDVGAV
jgi:hypothetical protein